MPRKPEALAVPNLHPVPNVGEMQFYAISLGRAKWRTQEVCKHKKF